MNLLSSTSVFGFYTLVSRVLGYLRDILIAIFLGTSIYADAFFVAFRLPNTFRRLFAEGTFNAAFIPSYSDQKIKGKKFAKKFADEVLSIISILLVFLIIIIEIFTPFIVYIIAPGFYENSEKFNLAVEFTRITFPFLLFVTLSSLLSGILNTNNKFAAAAAAPIILNVILILSLFLAFNNNLNIAKSLSVGVTLAGIFQFIILVIVTRKFYFPSILFIKKINNNIRVFFKKLIPSIFSSGITQINILIGTIIASFQSGAVSYLYYADRIYQINLAIAGIAIGTVALPNLAKSIKLKKQILVEKLQTKSIELCLLLSIPAALGLLIISEQIVNSLFGYGSFNKEDVYNTSQALIFFSFGLPAFALIKVLSNFYFARNNTKLPFYISFFVMLINIIISLSLFKEYGFIIIPIATSLSTWVGVIIYLIFLRRNKILFLKNILTSNIFKILISTFLMSIFLYNGLNYFEDKFEYSNEFKLIYLLIMVGLSSTLYLIIAKILGILNLKSYKIK
ncbi:MAG: murein biosynthesis integral membrane protein MurJ [Candidatus Pelagibacter sp. TMED196]|nr:MAG: murein biosynthesis integral membrane protein MurJ [Candidatus Pelagibacter sp. TMED196]|tara:strand:- start:6975 stop:8501 length:1527 start_codon:yes stop_codon:yes gene_type:complete